MIVAACMGGGGTLYTLLTSPKSQEKSPLHLYLPKINLFYDNQGQLCSKETQKYEENKNSFN